jgi:hypothetical protein
MVVVDGQEGAEYDAIREDTLIFSADGKRVAYRAWKSEKCMVVVDGEASAEYDAIAEGSPIFSADSRHVAYRAWKGARRLVVVDGQEAGAEYYDGIVKNGPTFHSDGVLEYLGIKDNSLYRVKYIPVP